LLNLKKFSKSNFVEKPLEAGFKQIATMALCKGLTLLAPTLKTSTRLIQTSSPNNFIFKGTFKNIFYGPALAESALECGWSKHVRALQDHPDDPLFLRNTKTAFKPEGSGTRCDPFIIKSPNTKQQVKVKIDDDDFDLPQFEVTLEDGGRCPATGAHYKLEHHPEWKVYELQFAEPDTVCENTK